MDKLDIPTVKKLTGISHVRAQCWWLYKKIQDGQMKKPSRESFFRLVNVHDLINEDNGFALILTLGDPFILIEMIAKRVDKEISLKQFGE